MRYRKKLAVERCLCLLLVSTFGIGALSQSIWVFASQSQPLQHGGTLIWGIKADPQTMLIGNHNFMIAGEVASQMFLGMTGLDTNLNPTPQIAKSWSTSSDGLTYTFNLYDNITWTDGVKLTSADVKWTWDNVITTVHPSAPLAKQIVKSVTAPDNYTVIYTLNFPFAPFIHSMHMINFGAVLPQHIYASCCSGSNATKLNNQPTAFAPIGDGPFMFKSYTKGQQVVLVRNPNYYIKAQPYFDSEVFRIIPAINTAVLALQSGDINYMSTIFPISSAASVGASSNVKVVSTGSEAYKAIVTVFFNLSPNNTSPITDVRVRQAIAYAVDRQTIADDITFGAASAAIGPFPDTFKWAYGPAWPYKLNTTIANQILDQAGYNKGTDGIRFHLRLVYTPYINDVIVASQVITQELQQIGIQLDVRSVDYATMASTVYGTRQFDLNIHRLGPGIPDPQGMAQIWDGKYIATNSPVGVEPSSYNNPQVNAMFDKAALELNQTKRGQVYQNISTQFQKDLPGIPLFTAVSLSAFATSIAGLPIGAWQGVDPVSTAGFIATGPATVTATQTQTQTRTTVINSGGTTITSVITSVGSSSASGGIDTTTLGIAAVGVAVVVGLAAIALRKRRP